MPNLFTGKIKLLPEELKDDQAYGLWNALSVHDEEDTRIALIAAHDGDFFPESPLDYIEALRKLIASPSGKHWDDNWPVRLDIDITQTCNCRCLFCYSQEYRKKTVYKKSYIDYELLRQIIELASKKGTRTIRFTGGGEPLMHPRINDILQLPAKYNLRSCVLTNGDLFDETLLSTFFEYIDHIHWSVNAASSKTRQRIHNPISVKSQLSDSFSSIHSLIKKRTQENGKRPMIWATFILHPYNIDEALTVGHMLRDIGVDSISFRPIYHGLGGSWKLDEMKRLDDLLPELKALSAPPKFFVFVPKRDIGDAGELKPESHFEYCLSRKLRTVLEATNDGIVLQKCGLYRGSGPKSYETIRSGDLFEDHWRGVQAQDPYLSIPSSCDNCIDVSMNTTLNEVYRILTCHPKARFYKAHLHNI